MKLKIHLITILTLINLSMIGKISVAQTVPDTSSTKSDSAGLKLNMGQTKNIGFGTQETTKITSAISTVKGSTLLKNFNTNIGNTLYGMIPGLTVGQGTSEPGINNPALYGRGQNTFGPGNGLLVIIDGFLGDFNQLVPEEVEEISLLKDASATAIYGSRGANGVLLISTKRGRIAPLSISFSSQQGFAQASGLPKFLDSYNYATLYNEALVNGGQSALYTPADLTAYQSGSDPLRHPNVNWYNEVLQKSAPVANYDINFKGGNSTVRYFALLHAVTSRGLFKNFGDMDDESSNSTYARYNFRTNMDINLTKRLSATFLFGGTVEEKSNPQSLYTSGTFNLLSIIPPNVFPARYPNGSFGYTSAYSNPVGNLLKTGYAESNGRTLQSSFRLNYDLSMITKGLSASGAISFNNYFASGSNKTKTYTSYSIGTSGDPVYTPNSVLTTSLVASEPNLGQYRNSAIQAFLNYHRVFGKHDVTVLSVFNSDNSTVDKSNIYSGDAAALSLPYKNNSVGGRITYINSEKYIGEFSMSYMGSENFAPGKQYGLFPAFSVGYIVSNENFLKSSNVLSFLKIRGSYGLVGNNEIGGQRFMYDQRYPNTQSYYYGTGNTLAGAIAEGTIANTNVTWEKERKSNIGIDAVFFKQLNFSVDFFKQDRYDILVSGSGSLPVILGYTGLPTLNQGKLNNKGFEAVLGYKNNEKSKIGFFAEINASYAKNQIIYNAQALQLNTRQITAGNPIGQPFGLRALGIFQTDAAANSAAKPIGISVKAGDIQYEDVGGPAGVPDGIIDGNDNQAIGNSGLPNLSIGLHSGFRYKGFDLDMVFQGVSGNTVYLGANQFRPLQGNGAAAGVIALDRFTPQTASTATFPRLVLNDQNNYRFSSFWQRDGSFIKMRSAEIGYSLNKSIISKFKVEQARIFINGTNLFSLDHIEYGDPEALSGYPALRTIILGARIQF